MKKIGLFFGSFDPIHIGHLSLLKECTPYFDNIELLPAYQNPFKKKSTPYSIRLLMCEEAIKETGLDDVVEVNSIERQIKNKYKVEAVKTVDVFSYIDLFWDNVEYNWIVTEETLLDIYTWEGYESLQKIPKMGFNLSKNTYENYKKSLNIQGNICSSITCSVHSSNIRSIKDGRPYITQNVYNIIKLKKLYND